MRRNHDLAVLAPQSGREGLHARADHGQDPVMEHRPEVTRGLDRDRRPLGERMHQLVRAEARRRSRREQDADDVGERVPADRERADLQQYRVDVGERDDERGHARVLI